MDERIVRAFPVLPGKRQVLEELIAAVRDRAVEMKDFYSRFGVARETWHLQEDDGSTWIIAVTELGPAAPSVLEVADRYSASGQEFDRWFKAQVLEISGIDPDQQPLGPATEHVFDSAHLGEG